MFELFLKWEDFAKTATNSDDGPRAWPLSLLYVVTNLDVQRANLGVNLFSDPTTAGLGIVSTY